MRFIGDVHGKYGRYKAQLKDSPPTIQVGDLGVGFVRSSGPRIGEFSQNPPYDQMVAGGHRFIRGNHDNPAECKKHKQWITDGHVENGMMFIGGAVSIDRAFRQEGYSWWADEELSAAELNVLVEKYIAAKPDVMVTHDCPEEVAEIVALEQWAQFGIGQPRNGGKLDPQHASRSRQAFQSMWSAHSPKLWVFGHWHHSFDRVLRGTRFVCLAELEMKDLELPSS